MTVDEYLAAVDNLARRCRDDGLSPHEVIDNPAGDAALVAAAVAFRRLMLTDQDRTDIRPYLEIGHFRWGNEDERLASFALCFATQDRLRLLHWKCLCEPYDRGQPLFRGSPSLFS